MTVWLCALLFMMIFTVFSFMGMRTEKNSAYTQWCYDILLDNGFNPPELHVMKADKRSCVKMKNGIIYIYLSDQGSEIADKKMLVNLVAFITSDLYKSDGQYYTNLDVLLKHAEDKEGFNRLDVRLK